MQVYADLFKENHITGKRLLLLTESDMRDMGVKSKGHVMHLKANDDCLPPRPEARRPRLQPLFNCVFRRGRLRS